MKDIRQNEIEKESKKEKAGWGAEGESLEALMGLGSK